MLFQLLVPLTEHISVPLLGELSIISQFYFQNEMFFTQIVNKKDKIASTIWKRKKKWIETAAASSSDLIIYALNHFINHAGVR